MTSLLVSAPFFGARGFKSESKISESAKLSIKAVSFGEAGRAPDEAGGNRKIFFPTEEEARFRKILIPTPFLPAK
ncbi:MAG TPA: hypothetical protein VF668_07855 [Pyrinomonadaceae bacterium]